MLWYVGEIIDSTPSSPTDPVNPSIEFVRYYQCSFWMASFYTQESNIYINKNKLNNSKFKWFLCLTITTVHSSATQNTMFIINTCWILLSRLGSCVIHWCHTESASLDMHSLVEETPQNQHKTLLLCLYISNSKKKKKKSISGISLLRQRLKRQERITSFPLHKCVQKMAMLLKLIVWFFFFFFEVHRTGFHVFPKI